jgi:hypothetical protein
MFFEPLPAGEKPAVPAPPELPSWKAAPALEAGAVLATELTVARSANVVVNVPSIRVHSSGCLFDVEVVFRQGAMSDPDWWDLVMSRRFGFLQAYGGAPLPDKLMRLGVRYADGTKATTLDQGRSRPQGSAEPAGPLLSWQPRSSGSHSGQLHFSGFGLWLWPLPPAETFEFAAEWPFGGIGLSIVELDGAAIAAAAARSAPYWPESGDS